MVNSADSARPSPIEPAVVVVTGRRSADQIPFAGHAHLLGHVPEPEPAQTAEEPVEVTR